MTLLYLFSPSSSPQCAYLKDLIAQTHKINKSKLLRQVSIACDSLQSDLFSNLNPFFSEFSQFEPYLLDLSEEG